MKVGDKVIVKTGPRHVGEKGEVIEKRKYIGAPLVLRLESGGLHHCWPQELQKA